MRFALASLPPIHSPTHHSLPHSHTHYALHTLVSFHTRLIRMLTLMQEATFHTLDLLGNPIGEEGLQAVIKMLESTSSIQSVCGGAPKTKEADFSGRGLQAVDMKIIAHELSSWSEVG